MLSSSLSSLRAEGESLVSVLEYSSAEKSSFFCFLDLLVDCCLEVMGFLVLLSRLSWSSELLRDKIVSNSEKKYYDGRVRYLLSLDAFLFLEDEEDEEEEDEDRREGVSLERSLIFSLPFWLWVPAREQRPLLMKSSSSLCCEEPEGADFLWEEGCDDNM